MKNLLTMFLVISVVGISFEDSNGDRSKEVVTITYSNGREDRLVVDRTMIDSPATEQAIIEIASKRIK